MASVCVAAHRVHSAQRHAPSVLQRLDLEAKGGGNGINILAIKLLHDGCLACVVQATVSAGVGK